MNQDEKWNFVKNTLENLRIEREKIQKVRDIISLEPESPILEPFYIVSDCLVETLSKLIGDEQDYIEWFVFENEFGKGELSAGLIDDRRIIKTYDDLRWLIELRVPEPEYKVENE